MTPNLWIMLGVSIIGVLGLIGGSRITTDRRTEL
jgi:hypothetical protein